MQTKKRDALVKKNDSDVMYEYCTVPVSSLWLYSEYSVQKDGAWLKYNEFKPNGLTFVNVKRVLPL